MRRFSNVILFVQVLSGVCQAHSPTSRNLRASHLKEKLTVLIIFRHTLYDTQTRRTRWTGHLEAFCKLSQLYSSSDIPKNYVNLTAR
jgi:hypothetical protein